MNICNPALEGKVAIVTGGGTGIGRSIALEFAKAGADVAICGRNAANLEKVAEEVDALGKRCLAVPTDTSRRNDVDNLVQKVLDEFAGIDILVNNAATSSRTPFLEITEREWDEIIDTNLKGYFLCSQAVAKIMATRKNGNIINVASIEGLRPINPRNTASYFVSKAGVIMLTKAIAKELAKYNIRVNGIAPGATRTGLLERIVGDPEQLNQLEALYPLGRVAEPREIASVAVFLASGASSFITGHIVVVDGGRTL